MHLTQADTVLKLVDNQHSRHKMPLAVAVVAAGEMGAAVAARLVKHGLSVYTSLEGRSNATRKRATDAGMQDVPFDELALRAEWVLSILPPSEAFTFAQRFVNTTVSSAIRKDKLVFVDCNAVSPKTAKTIANLFEPTFIRFVDAGIIGGPPSDTYNPTIYASTDKEDEDILDEFARFNDFGLKISPLKGEGVAGVGDASALKMSYAGITKGITGIFSTMILVLAAHNASPATSSALLAELHESQPQLLHRLSRSVPGMIPKAYRWAGEMEEISDFVGGGEGDVYKGLAALYKRIDGSLEKEGRTKGDVGTLLQFSANAKDALDKDNS